MPSRAPQTILRLPPPLKARAVEFCKQRNKTLNSLVTVLLEEKLNREAALAPAK